MLLVNEFYQTLNIYLLYSRRIFYIDMDLRILVYHHVTEWLFGQSEDSPLLRRPKKNQAKMKQFVAILLLTVMLNAASTRGKKWYFVPAYVSPTLIARSMGPTWGPSGADRTQVGPMLAPWTLLSGHTCYWLSCCALITLLVDFKICLLGEQYTLQIYLGFCCAMLCFDCVSTLNFNCIDTWNYLLSGLHCSLGYSTGMFQNL